MLLVFVLCLSGCRTSKNIDSAYKEQGNYSQTTETNIQEEGKATVAQKEEKETKTTSMSEKAEYFPPTPENPAGGAPKVIERTFYLTDEKAINAVTSSYEKQLTEKGVVIENLEKKIEELESQDIKSDSRPVQGSEWLWVGISFFIALAICILVCYIYVKKKLSVAGVVKKIL